MATSSIDRPLAATGEGRRRSAHLRPSWPAPRWPALAWCGRAVVVVAALVPIAVYLYVALRRIGYPFELEWLEGGAVEIVQRAADGRSIYVAPSLHFVPYPYTPLYFWVSAALAKVTGVGFLPLRLVSFVSSLGCLAVLFRLVQRQTGDAVAGVLAAGLFAATYRIGLAWLDIGRVDSLYLLFTLLAVLAAQRALRTGGRGRRGAESRAESEDGGTLSAGPDVHDRAGDGNGGGGGGHHGSDRVTPDDRRALRPGPRNRTPSAVGSGVLVGLLVFAAFFTKQSGLLALGPMLVLLAVLRFRTGLVALATAAVAVAVSTVVLDATTHGWYDYYVFHELVHQGVVSSVWHTFLRVDLFHPLSGAVLLAGGGIVVAGLWTAVRWRGERASAPTERPAGTGRRSGVGTGMDVANWMFWLAVAAGLIGSSWVARLHSGGQQDVLIPAFAALALLAALGYASLLRTVPPLVERLPGTSGWSTGRGRSTGRTSGGATPGGLGRAVVSVALTGVIVIQLAALRYPIAPFVPRAADYRAGWHLIHLIASRPGEVIVFDHPWYENMAGKPSFAQAEAAHDVLRAGPSQARTDLRRSIHQVLYSPAVTTVFGDDRGDTIGPGFFQNFAPGPKVFSCYRCFFPLTDVPRRPYLMYVRPSGPSAHP